MLRAAINKERFEERDLIANFGMPDDFCTSEVGTKKVLKTEDAVLNVRCTPCYEGHYKSAAAWFHNEANHYKESDTFTQITGEEKTHPYFIFYKLHHVACLSGH